MKRIVIKALKLYQLMISPLIGQCCRFYPTCSNYMIEAVEAHGVCRGTWLGVKRLLKCHPFHPGGVDLVPAMGNVAKDPPPASRTPPEEGSMASIPSLGGVAVGRGGFNS